MTSLPSPKNHWALGRGQQTIAGPKREAGGFLRADPNVAPSSFLLSNVVPICKRLSLESL